MICQHCRKKEATTHFKQNINGAVTQLYLCDACAEGLGVMDEFKIPSINEIIGGFLGAGMSEKNSLAGVERCQTCGSSFNDIVKSGKIGCANCYDKFKEKLAPSIDKLHSKAKHIGKYVSYTEDNNGENDKFISDIDMLKMELKQAIREQRFEDAAVLRDKINDLVEEGNE